MRQKVFPSSSRIEESDMNKVHVNTEAALRDLLAAISGGQNLILFKNQAPSIVENGANWDITIPAMYFAINGVIAQIPQQVVNAAKASGERQIDFYLRVIKQDVSEDRSFINLSPQGTDAAVGVKSFVVEKEDVPQLITQDPATTVPTSITGQVGPTIKLAVINITNSGNSAVLSSFDPENRLWDFPGSALPASHGASHAGNGSDPIPVASASAAGLLSTLEFGTVRRALTGIEAASTSPFIVISEAGDNTATNARKEATVNLRTNEESFVVEDPLGSAKLGLNFANGSNAGSSNQPARNDHTHRMEESPVQIAQRIINITQVSQLGTSINIDVPVALGVITNISVFWTPPGVTGNRVPQVQTQLMSVVNNGSNSWVGARGTISSSSTVSVRVGDYALAHITEAEKQLAQISAGSVTWDSASGSNGLFPTTGSLIIYITGVRSGVPLRV